MPADPALDAGSLADEVVAMVDQQPHLARRAAESGGGQIRFAPRRAGDRERVDRVGLAGLTGAATDAGHHLRRYPNDPLAGAHEVGLQRAREMPAILQRPAAAWATGWPRQALPDSP